MTRNVAPSTSRGTADRGAARPVSARLRTGFAAARSALGRGLRWAFCPHKRLLVKIVPHDGAAVYKLDVSHRQLSCGVLMAAALFALFVAVHVCDVRAAEARSRALVALEQRQGRQLAAFSAQTQILWQKVGRLQRDDEEMHRLTRVIAPVAHRPVAGTTDRAHNRAGVRPVQPARVASAWQVVSAWLAGLPTVSNVGFEAEAAELSSLSRTVDVTAQQTQALAAGIRAAADRVIAAREARERYLAAIPSIWPTVGYISSGFGYRSYPDAEFHPGLDIVNSYGAPIYATAAGQVVAAGWDGGYGLRVIIDHGNGLQTMYAHASQILVQNGQTVHKGQEIALVGTTGFATGPHVHYEIELWGKPIDPTPYLNGSVTVVAQTAP